MKHLKSEFDKLTFKEFYTFILAGFCLLGAFVLVFIGLYMPPQGELHPSVITLFGIVLGFVGAIIGLDNHYKTKTQEIESLYENRQQELENKINRQLNTKHNDTIETR